MKLPPFAWLQCYSRCISYIVMITTVVLNRLLSPTGLRKNTSMPLTTSPPHPHRPTGVPPIPKHLVIQTPHPHRSTHSTTHKHQGHQPCESTGQAASAQPLPTATVSSSPPSPTNVLFAPFRYRYNTDQFSPYAAPSPQGSYQPSPSPQSYHQVAPSPAGYQNTHSPASYHPTPSPMAYQVLVSWHALGGVGLGWASGL